MTTSPSNLQQQFERALRSLGVRRTRLLVAVSGGADSLALLELLARCAAEFELMLTVAHVDHGIAAASPAVADDVAAEAARRNLAFVLERLELGADATETLARAGRWSALERMRMATEANFIVTAHHLDDQAETVLMRVIRGSGPAGLAAMAADDGRILRPLLPFRRDELAQYLHLRGLGHWSDPANRDLRHDRAWIRHRMMPLLEGRWPRVTETLDRVATRSAERRDAWDAVLDLLPNLDVVGESDGISVAGGTLGGYSSQVSLAVLEALARRVGLVLSRVGAERALGLARSGGSGRWVPLGQGWSAASAFGRLRLERPEPVPERLQLTAGESEFRWGGWRLHVTPDEAPARQERRGAVAWFGVAGMAVRPPRTGERMQPLGSLGHRPLVRLLQEARIPSSQRRRWPVIELEGSALWLPGVCRSQADLPEPGTEALRIDAIQP